MPNTSHIAFFGDREREFALPAELILELERVTGLGIGGLFKTLAANTFGFSHVVETVRLGLIGGGATPEEAANLVKVYVARRPLSETFPLALSILESVWFGAPPVQPVAPSEGEGAS